MVDVSKFPENSIILYRENKRIKWKLGVFRYSSNEYKTILFSPILSSDQSTIISKDAYPIKASKKDLEMVLYNPHNKYLINTRRNTYLENSEHWCIKHKVNVGDLVMIYTPNKHTCRSYISWTLSISKKYHKCIGEIYGINKDGTFIVNLRFDSNVNNRVKLTNVPYFTLHKLNKKNIEDRQHIQRYEKMISVREYNRQLEERNKSKYL